LPPEAPQPEGHAPQPGQANNPIQAAGPQAADGKPGILEDEPAIQDMLKFLPGQFVGYFDTPVEESGLGALEDSGFEGGGEAMDAPDPPADD
jgi:hypothetical protein